MTFEISIKFYQVCQIYLRPPWCNV